MHGTPLPGAAAFLFARKIPLGKHRCNILRDGIAQCIYDGC
jgi:hypothetical protein